MKGMNEKILRWLSGFPGLGELALDALGAGEGAGLFPQGIRETVTRDILGGGRIAVVWTGVVRVHRRAQGDAQALLEKLADWVRRGIPEEGMTARLEDARLESLSKEGMTRCQARLVVELERRQDV